MTARQAIARHHARHANRPTSPHRAWGVLEQLTNAPGHDARPSRLGRQTSAHDRDAEHPQAGQILTVEEWSRDDHPLVSTLTHLSIHR